MKDRLILAVGFIAGGIVMYATKVYNAELYIVSVEYGEHYTTIGIASTKDTGIRIGDDYAHRNGIRKYTVHLYTYNVDNPSIKYTSNAAEESKTVLTGDDFLSIADKMQIGNK